ncbi:MAG: hypothetical protein PF440_01525, partial [Thiomicrorhabdus sp.]|nr:hypothetical protein [Thiomicrorhabdus sp.]
SRSIKGYLDNEKSIVMSLRKIRRIMVEQRLEVQTQKKFKTATYLILRIPESSLISWIGTSLSAPPIKLGLQI